MFSQDKFIAASRDFVCVRLESYESEEHQELVRGLLRGAFANTAFCVLAPDGKARLSASGRSPSTLVSRRRGPSDDVEGVVRALEKISSEHPSKGEGEEAVLQDFHTTRQAINVASGDQRLLLLTVVSEGRRESIEKTLKEVLNDSDIVGRFHHDFTEKSSGESWGELAEKEKGQAGFLIVQADEFGMKGAVVAELSLNTEAKELKDTLLRVNEVFSESEERKVYSAHVSQGRRNRVYFKGGMPYGEDRDGDGQIDAKRGRR